MAATKNDLFQMRLPIKYLLSSLNAANVASSNAATRLSLLFPAPATRRTLTTSRSCPNFASTKSPTCPTGNRWDFSRVHATLRPALPDRRSVHKTLLFFTYTANTGSYYCSCPNTWLAFLVTAPAHQHATWVAMYLVLFHSNGAKKRSQ